MNSNQLRAAVQSFRDSSGHGQSTPHCFAPWYLSKQFEVAAVQAITQSSDGNYDFGLDAFHLNDSSPPTLVLVQAKFTSSLTLIAKGYADLGRALVELSRHIDGIATEAPIQNGVLRNLRARLNHLTQEARKSLRVPKNIRGVA